MNIINYILRTLYKIYPFIFMLFFSSFLNKIGIESLIIRLFIVIPVTVFLIRIVDKIKFNKDCN